MRLDKGYCNRISYREHRTSDLTKKEKRKLMSDLIRLLQKIDEDLEQ